MPLGRSTVRFQCDNMLRMVTGPGPLWRGANEIVCSHRVKTRKKNLS
jgi:hypothetical protein